MNREKKKRTLVYLDLQFNGLAAGRVVIELFDDKVPKTSENFRSLCTGEKGNGNKGKPLHFKGIRFHKVVPMCMVFCGDIINNNGTSGESIYGDYFEDENFSVKHNTEGIIGMVNMGPNTNQSQFYITTQPCFQLDNTNVAFGKVIKGLNILVEMSDFPREDDKPQANLVIADCGELEPGKQLNIAENDGTEDKYPSWPDDWDEKTDNVGVLEKTVIAIKNSGNYYYKKNDFANAERKYIKCLRYIDWHLNKKNEEHLQMSLKLTLMGNLAAAQYKTNKYKECVFLCSQVLKDQPQNGKVYYRRAQALLGLKEYDRALSDLRRASSLHPKDENIIRSFKRAKKDKLMYLKKEQLFYSKLFK